MLVSQNSLDTSFEETFNLAKRFTVLSIINVIRMSSFIAITFYCRLTTTSNTSESIINNLAYMQVVYHPAIRNILNHGIPGDSFCTNVFFIE